MNGEIRTDIGRANADRITLRGRDVVDELVGHVSFTEAALLAITGITPKPGAVRVADAVLVTFIDHGLQPSALIARMTYHLAPEALQGAIAAGLLGGGSQILGTMEQAGQLLHQVRQSVAAGVPEDEAVDRVIAGELEAKRRIAGVGHALHRGGDPRVRPLLAVAAAEGIAADEIRCLNAIAEVTTSKTGRKLLPNAAGVSAALLFGIGIPWRLHRGFALTSRTAGLLAHIGEETDRPLTPAVRESLRAASWLDDN